MSAMAILRQLRTPPLSIPSLPRDGPKTRAALRRPLEDETQARSALLPGARDL
jgi:hypothetical protein